jgi:hypothetical protein
MGKFLFLKKVAISPVQSLLDCPAADTVWRKFDSPLI